MDNKIILIILLAVTYKIIRQDVKNDIVAAGEVIDPTNKNNYVNSMFERGYTALTGSDENLGEDAYDTWSALKERF